MRSHWLDSIDGTQHWLRGNTPFRDEWEHPQLIPLESIGIGFAYWKRLGVETPTLRLDLHAFGIDKGRPSFWEHPEKGGRGRQRAFAYSMILFLEMFTAG